MRPSRDELLSAIERLRRQAQADKEMLAYRKNEVAAGIREAEALRTRNAALVAALKAVEWEGDDNSCLLCFRKSNEGHMADCEIGTALRAAEPD